MITTVSPDASAPAHRTWPLVVAAVCLLVYVGLVALLGFGDVGGFWALTWLANLVMGAVIVARAPGNVVGTLLFASGLLSQISTPFFTGADGHPIGQWLNPIGQAINTPAQVLLPLMLLRFPDGRLPGPRWRRAEVLGAVVMAVGAIAAFINNGWGGDVGQARVEGPLRDDFGSVGDQLSALFFPGMMAVTLAGMASIVLHYRQGTAQQRIQVRWLLFAVALFIPVLLVVNIGVSQTSATTNLTAALTASAMALIPVSIGIAIVRHQLFDIDVVISRTLVYVSVLAVITVVYVAIVFGVGTLIGQSSDSPVLPIVATAVIAIVFHPVRVRLERLANRIVFGRRATPYEVLSEFTQRVAATDDELLVDVARSLADGTIATSATVWTVHDDRLEPVSVWPERQGVMATALVRAEATGSMLAPGADETYPIEHDGELIGALGLSVPAGESLPPGDLALIGELTAGIGLALWNRGLTSQLQASVDDLRASRRRLVAIQDDTRHQLERDLHDGAQQRLVAVKVRLSIAQQMAAKAGADERAHRLAALCVEADGAIESLRDFARGVYPPLLEAEGLRTALKAHADRSPFSIEVTGSVEHRQHREVEATAYFCVVETLALIERAGAVDAVEITLSEQPERLAFDVRALHAGTWELALPERVHDRIEAVDGVLACETSAGTTTVTGSVPIPAVGQHHVERVTTAELIDR